MVRGVDSGMPDPETPAVTVGLRGMVDVDVSVRTAPRNLHSGMYGGTVLNALHVLHGQLANVTPAPDGRVRDELRAGTAPVADAEVRVLAPPGPGRPGHRRERRPAGGSRGRRRVLRAHRRGAVGGGQPDRRRRAAPIVRRRPPPR